MMWRPIRYSWESWVAVQNAGIYTIRRRFLHIKCIPRATWKLQVLLQEIYWRSSMNFTNISVHHPKISVDFVREQRVEVSLQLWTVWILIEILRLISPVTSPNSSFSVEFHYIHWNFYLRFVSVPLPGTKPLKHQFNYNNHSEDSNPEIFLYALVVIFYTSWFMLQIVFSNHF